MQDLKELKAAAAIATPGPWSVWTSNSYRRIVSDATGAHVIDPTIQRHDNHPDLHFPNGGHNGPDAKYIAAASPNVILSLIAELEQLRAEKASMAMQSADHADDADADRYNAFTISGLPICFLGVEYHDKQSLDAAIDKYLAGMKK